MRKPAALEDGWLPVESLTPWEKNPRVNDGPATAKVAESIQRFGFVAPIVIWRGANRMVAGHTRLKALKEILAKDPSFIPKGAPKAGVARVVFHEFTSEDEADAYALADNKLGELAVWEDKSLALILEGLRARQVDLQHGTGFRDWQINGLLQKMNRPCPVVDKETAEDLQKRWKTARGQIWEVKSKTVDDTHRIMCGDSTNEAEVKKLLAGRVMDCIVTDPPFDLLAEQVIKAADFFSTRMTVMTGGLQVTNLLRAALDWHLCFDLVWTHRTPRMYSPDRPLLNHQWILFMSKGKTKIGWKRPISTYGSVMSIEGAEYDPRYMGHAKACEIFSHMVRGYEWTTMCDPFLGSGATLLGCENADKVLYGMELDPVHFAVSLERLSHAGLHPKKLKG